MLEILSDNIRVGNYYNNNYNNYRAASARAYKAGSLDVVLRNQWPPRDGNRRNLQARWKTQRMTNRTVPWEAEEDHNITALVCVPFLARINKILVYDTKKTLVSWELVRCEK